MNKFTIVQLLWILIPIHYYSDKHMSSKLYFWGISKWLLYIILHHQKEFYHFIYRNEIPCVIKIILHHEKDLNYHFIYWNAIPCVIKSMATIILERDVHLIYLSVKIVRFPICIEVIYSTKWMTFRLSKSIVNKT